MRLLILLKDFLGDLRQQKLRSTLTILGIAWGTVAVVVLLAFGVGLEKQMKKNAGGIGENVVIVFPGRTSISHQGFPEGRYIQLQERDVALIRGEVQGIDEISPEYARYTPVRRDHTTSNADVTGVYPGYGAIRNVLPAPGGRFINALDMDGRRRVAVLGDKLKERLFGDAEAIGEQVFVGETPFTVVGVMEAKTQNSSYGARDQDRIFIPSTTFLSVYGVKRVDRIVYRGADPADAERVHAEIREVLGRRHRFDPTDRDAAPIWDTSEQMRFFKYLFLGFNIFLGVVGSFTLVVGGIGVANIMYIVVRERTREIGVRRALGARRLDILSQIMTETLLIVGIGAGLGFVLATTLVAAGAMLPMQEEIGTPEMSTLVLLATLSLLGVIGLLAGLFPARRAANLDPVESLRHGV
jgi:putative ABC transport system permease protein